MISKNSRVLVVDDNPMSRNLIKYRLEMDGIDVVPLSSGEEALDAVKQGPVSLIFLDLLMDGLNGLDVLWALKADAASQGIPVVVVSGVEDAATADEVIHAGAADFLPKPVTASVLSEIVVDLLHLKQAKTADSDVALDPNDYPVFDPAATAQLVKDYGADTVNGFAARFTDLAPEKLGAILAAEMAGDADAWRRAVSALKGGARTLGLARLATACRIVERALDGGDTDQAAKTTATLRDHLTAALAELDAHPAAS